MDRPSRPDQIHRPERAIKDDVERELLGDIVQSPGWNVFQERIVRVFAQQRMQTVLSHVAANDMQKAQACLAAAHAGVEILVGAFEGAGLEVPKEVRALVQTTVFASRAESALHERGPGEPASD